MISAVLDTNIIVSAHLVREGRQALILELGLGRAFDWVASAVLLAEYEEVLRRPRFRIEPSRISQSLAAIRSVVRLVTPPQRLRVTSDPDDDMVLECALEGSADYVVTGNLRHFPTSFRGVRVISPRTFLLILAGQVGT